MNVRRTIYLLLLNRKQLISSSKVLSINVRVNHQCSVHKSSMMQKSLLSFFKPLDDKSQVTPKKEETSSEKSVKQSPDESKSNVIDSPVCQKKRRRIIALESDSDEENINEQHPVKKTLDGILRTYERKSKLPKATLQEPANIESIEEVNDASEKSDSGDQKLEEPEKDELVVKKSVSLRKEDIDANKTKTAAKTDQPKAKKTPERNSKSPANKKTTPTFFTKIGTIKPAEKENIPKKSSKSPKKDSNDESVPESSETDPSTTPKTEKKMADIFTKSAIRKKTSPKRCSTSPKKSDNESETENVEGTEKKLEITKQPASKTPKKKAKTEKSKNGVSRKSTYEDDELIWKHGMKTPYLSLAKTLQKVEETSARLKIIDILANYFRKVIMSNKSDLLPSIYLCLNTLGPAYEGLELGVADTYLMKAVAQCTGRTLAQIKADVAKTGDLGIVAEQSRSNQKLMFRPAALTVQGVFNHLSDIAIISGQNAIKKKIDKIQALFVACQECEARFIIRSLAGKLRIGLAEQSVLQALALACTTTPPNQEDPPAIEDASTTMSPAEFKKRVEEESLILKTTYCECPNYNLIVPVLLEHGIRELPKYCKITPGIPVKPMLAHPTKGVHEVFQRFDNIEFTCEWKYDGERAQIHMLEDGTIRIYSRNQEDNTSKYPDIIEDIRQSFKSEMKSCIIDAEAVAWDREQRKIMPFQILSTRKRKDADLGEIKVRICVFLFDLLYVNGESLTQKPLIERRNMLKEHLQEVEEKFKFVTSIDTHTMEEVHEFLEESVKGNCEGLMVKTLETEATYEIAKRSRNWLKLKKDYLEGCGDTLDLVVIGGYIGKGKRTGQYGGFLLASYDADTDEYQTICKIGTGFTEEALATHSEFLKQHVIPKAKPYYIYDESHEPDHWFDAVQVWEVKCADLSLSPTYSSAIGLVDQDKGVSLRFPRFLRIREDKSVEQATSSQQVAELYKNQDQIKNASANESKFNEEDFCKR